MRLEAIRRTREMVGGAIPACSPEDISGRINLAFQLNKRDALRRRMIRTVAGAALALQQGRFRRILGCPLGFSADALCLDERFGDDASTAALLTMLHDRTPKRVLIPGCYLGGEDVQFWLRRGVERLDGIDLNSLSASWAAIVPQLRQAFGAEVHFQQAPLEQLPFAPGSFDLIATTAVLEHVQNLPAVSAETARVLKPGGIAWHSFGPLYYGFGADHCIAAYGEDSGFDHLLLSEEDYQSRIRDQAFFDCQPDPNLPFWALRNQFSFARASEYLSIFERDFKIRHVIAKISKPALSFRRRQPDKWRLLLEAGILEEDLLIKGLSVLLQKAAES